MSSIVPRSRSWAAAWSTRDAPVIDVDDVGMTRGQAAFETIRVYAGRPFALDEHLDRLCPRPSGMRLPAPDPARSSGLAQETLAAADVADCSLRFTVTGGREGGHRLRRRRHAPAARAGGASAPAASARSR